MSKAKQSIQKLDPYACASREAVYSEELPLRTFSRLREFLVDDSGVVIVTASFYYNDKKKAVFDLQLQTELHLRLEHSDEPLILPYAVELTLQPLSSESIEQGVKSEYESCEMLNNTLNLVDIIEDTLLLALPMQL